MGQFPIASALLANDPVVDVIFNQSLVSNGSSKVKSMASYRVSLSGADNAVISYPDLSQ